MPLAPTLIGRNERLLDNPIWNALGSKHARFAESTPLARRYPAAVTPLAGIPTQSPEAYGALARLLGPKGGAGVFADEPIAPTPPLAIVRAAPLAQMICTALRPSHRHTNPDIVPLNASAVPAMMELTALTDPGPFGPRTYELGIYLGVFRSGQLVAMAGERLRCEGFAEVSAVCTHPDHQGHGYASALVTAIVAGMVARGEICFLHVRVDNTAAIRVYERLGFTTRRVLNFAVLQASAQ